MTVLITLTAAGTDTGPFNLYSNLDGYLVAFETGITQGALLAGYTSTLVPDYTETVRVKSTGACINYVDIPLVYPTTTTTTTVAPTTTTTTTLPESYTVNVTSDTWVDNATACANYTTIDIPLYSPDAVLTVGVTILYTDLALTTPFVGDGLYYVTSYGGNRSIVIEGTGLINEVNGLC